jgi:hypothetical protein
MYTPRRWYILTLALHLNKGGKKKRYFMNDLSRINLLRRLLRTPERVPFRLTRDIVDGLGCYGVEVRIVSSCVPSLMFSIGPFSKIL